MALLKAWLAGAVTMGILGGLFHGELAAGYLASQLPNGATMPSPGLVALGLIRVRGHRPKGGYDGQNGIKAGRETSATTVL